MGISSILTGINLIAIIFLFVVVFFIFLQIKTIQKEWLKEKLKPKIPPLPKFNDNLNNYSNGLKPSRIFPLNNTKKDLKIKQEKFHFFYALFLFLLLATLLVFIVSSQDLNLRTFRSRAFEKIDIPQGIKIFDKNWNTLNTNNLFLKEGDVIIIGINRPKNSDINKARIRVNKDTWTNNDETVFFNPSENVFFIEYKIDSNNHLKIEGQIHSKNQGWLD